MTNQGRSLMRDGWSGPALLLVTGLVRAAWFPAAAHGRAMICTVERAGLRGGQGSVGHQRTQMERVEKWFGPATALNAGCQWLSGSVCGDGDGSL